MSIDWFTVIAQVLNFLVLVWILKRFLYRPVLGAIEARQARVRKSMIEAAEQRELATTALAKLEEERRALDEEREEALRGARREAADEKRRLIEEAREEYETSRARWRQALENEREEFQRELSRQAHGEVIGIADKLLRDLADTDLQERILAKFLEKLENLSAEETIALSGGGKASPERAPVIRSAFPLSQPRREDLEKAVRNLLGAGSSLEFETKPALGCGIELNVDGHKIGWTLEDYLRSLDTWVKALVNDQRRRQAV